MEAMFGTSPGVFIGLTVVLLGFAAFLTGQALAGTWRPMWQALPYGLLLGAADRFLGYALFGGELLSVPGYLLNSAVLILISLFAYRITRVQQMITQYPWLYERSGVLGWRERR